MDSKTFISFPIIALKKASFFRTVRHPNYYLNIIPELIGLLYSAMPGIHYSWTPYLRLFARYTYPTRGKGHERTIGGIKFLHLYLEETFSSYIELDRSHHRLHVTQTNNLFH